MENSNLDRIEELTEKVIQYEVRLQESIEKFYAIFEQAVSSIILINADNGNIVEFNKRAHEELEYTQREFKKITISDFEAMMSEKEVRNVIEEIVKKGKIEFRTKHKTKTNVERDVIVKAKSIKIGGRLYCLCVWDYMSEQLQFVEKELVTRNRIAEVFLTVSNDKVYEGILPILLDITDSKHGVFGYINDKGNVVFPSLVTDFGNQCETECKGLEFPINTGVGGWGRAIMESRIICVNRPMESLPGGHIPIDRILIAPIHYKYKLIGIVEVANKESDYTTHDEGVLKAVIDYMAPILDAKLARDKKIIQYNEVKSKCLALEKKYSALKESTKDD